MPFLSMFVNRADGSNHTAQKLNNFVVWIDAIKSFQCFTTTAFQVVAYRDSLDWKDYGADSIVKKCTEHKNLGKGSIILMHNGAKYTPDALERVITGLKDKGYELVPISQLIHKGEFTIDHTGRQHKK